MLLTLALAAASATASNADVLSAFDAVCVKPRTIAERTAAVEHDHWQKFEPKKGEALFTVITVVRPMLEKQGIASNFQTYRRTIDGTSLQLSITESQKALAAGGKLLGCSLYDFDAATMTEEAPLDALVGTKTAESSSIDGALVRHWIEPFGSHSDMRNVFIPKDSKLVTALGFSGEMLGTSFLDGASE